MKITFDPAKDILNRNKHGVSLAKAGDFNWNNFLWEIDTRNDYGEDREIGVGTIGSDLYCVVYVERGDTRRIISLRRATKREEDAYATRY
jgi:uncharacterized DUF497 family protein